MNTLFPKDAGDDDKEIEHGYKRIQEALDTLSNFFSGVVIIAHVYHPQTGHTRRYIKSHGDPLAIRKNAEIWLNTEAHTDMFRHQLGLNALMQKGEDEGSTPIE